MHNIVVKISTGKVQYVCLKDRFQSDVGICGLKVVLHVTFFWLVSVITADIKCVLFIVIRITERKWVHHPLCLLFAPSPLEHC